MSVIRFDQLPDEMVLYILDRVRHDHVFKLNPVSHGMFAIMRLVCKRFRDISYHHMLLDYDKCRDFSIDVKREVTMLVAKNMDDDASIQRIGQFSGLEHLQLSITCLFNTLCKNNEIITRIIDTNRCLTHLTLGCKFGKTIDISGIAYDLGLIDLRLKNVSGIKTSWLNSLRSLRIFHISTCDVVSDDAPHFLSRLTELKINCTPLYSIGLHPSPFGNEMHLSKVEKLHLKNVPARMLCSLFNSMHDAKYNILKLCIEDCPSIDASILFNDLAGHVSKLTLVHQEVIDDGVNFCADFNALTLRGYHAGQTFSIYSSKRNIGIGHLQSFKLIDNSYNLLPMLPENLKSEDENMQRISSILGQVDKIVLHNVCKDLFQHIRNAIQIKPQILYLKSMSTWDTILYLNGELVDINDPRYDDRISFAQKHVESYDIGKIYQHRWRHH